jgi:hypothetical protein
MKPLLMAGFLKFCVRITEQFPLLLCFYRFHNMNSDL